MIHNLVRNTRVKISLGRSRTNGCLPRRGIRNCAFLALSSRVAETSSPVRPDISSVVFRQRPYYNEPFNQQRFVQSCSSMESQTALDILREVHNRIMQESKFSPVLSSHRRRPATNISTLESKETVAMAGSFGKLYRKLPPIQWSNEASNCQRRQSLDYLARQCNVNREAVDKAVAIYDNVMREGEVAPQLETYNRLHDVSAPLYHEILRYLLLDHAAEGMESIVCLREDLRSWIRSINATDEDRANLLTHLKRLDEHLQEILSVWFVPGLLEHRRLTYETTSASILENIVRYEAVHPVRSLKDLRRRLGPDRRVFAIFHPTLGEQPLYVLYVALQTSIPRSMATIQKVEESPPAGDTAAKPTVACFYSISNIRKGLVGVGMGEYLIHETVERLQKEVPSLNTFCTLSPIPAFRQWLEGDVERFDWIQQKDREILAESLDCSPDVAVQTLLDYLKNLDDKPALPSLPNVEDIMCRWAAHYLYNEKHRRKPLDRVARFHISNGAIMDQLHWGADLSRKGWQNSFGLMVTYRYDLMQLPSNQRNFESNNSISLGDPFSRYLNH